jgi:hypothetical protein
MESIRDPFLRIRRLLVEIRKLNLALAIAALTAGAHAQIDLGGLSTRIVKAGAISANLTTKIDSVTVDTRMENGVAVSHVKLTWTPSNAISSGSTCIPVSDTAKGLVPCDYRIMDLGPVDSLESALYFNLGSGSAITDMWLWVDGVKVPAALQRSSLAQAQYNQIVGARRDPALLNSWGNGSYHLQVFPLSSGKARSVELRIVQTVADGAIPFPVSFRSGWYSLQDSLTLGSLKATWPAELSLNLPGEVGRDSDGRKTINLTKVKELAKTSFGGYGASTWSGTREGKGYLGGGFKATFDQVQSEAPPGARLLVLDGGTTRDSLMRAIKFTLIQVKQLIEDKTPTQLLLRQADGSVTQVFPDYVVLGPDELQNAYAALVAWTPGKASSWDLLGQIAAKYARKGKVAVLLQSGQPDEVFSDPNPSNYRYNSPEYLDWQVRYTAFYARITAKQDSIGKLLTNAGMDLFTFTNSWELQGLASNAGGGNLGRLDGVPSWMSRVNDTGWSHLDLYGPKRVTGNRGLWIDSVTATGVDSLYWSQQYGNYGIAYASKMMLVDCFDCGYGYGRIDTLDMNWAAQAKPGTTAAFRVTGRWGGLRFVKEITTSTPAGTGLPEAGAAWAQMRLDGRKDWTDGQLDWKVGMAFHMATSGVSLLALEPGMTLWDDTTKGNNPNTPKTSSGTAAMDRLYLESANAVLDSVSLEDIVAGRATGIRSVSGKSVGQGLMVRGSREIRFTLPGVQQAGAMKIQDLMGRTVATVTMERDGTGYAATWQAPAGRRTLVAQVKADGKVWSRTFQAGE